MTMLDRVRLTRAVLFLACAVLIWAFPLRGQNPCGTAPHCGVLTWTAPATGGQVTGYNVKRGTTTGGPYTQIGSTVAPIVTFTDLSATGNVLVEGTKYFWVVTATGPGGESVPSNEVNGTIPFSLPASPTAAAVTVH